MNWQEIVFSEKIMASEWVVLYLTEPVWGEQCTPPSGRDCSWGLRLLWYYHIHSQIHKKDCHTSYWLCHEYQWLLFFWTHSTKQTVKNVHAWLRSTWPPPYIQFNGIMNTQYKGIVHDTKLLYTMHDLCHWFCSFKGLYFWHLFQVVCLWHSNKSPWQWCE